MKYRIYYKFCDINDNINDCTYKALRPVIQMKFLNLFWITIKKFTKCGIKDAQTFATQMYYLLTEK